MLSDLSRFPPLESWSSQTGAIPWGFLLARGGAERAPVCSLHAGRSGPLMAQRTDSRAWDGGMAPGWAWGAGAELSGVASSLLLGRVAEQGLNKGTSRPVLRL